MRLRPVLLGLCLAACSPSGADDGFADSLTLADDTLGEPGSSSGPTTAEPSSSGAAPTTSGDPTTGLPEPDTGDLTTTTDPSLATSSGGDSSTGDTGGPPADCPRVRVVVPPGEVLNVRPQPSTAGEPVGTLTPGYIADVLAVVPGEVLEGNGEWFEIEAGMIGGYVWSGLVECTLDEPPTDGFFLPLECGTTTTVTQGNFGDFSHQNKSAYAFDFSLGIGTPLVAIAAGTVTNLYAGTQPGDPCYDGGGMECNNAANFVVLSHGDGTASIYGHLSAVDVVIGQQVPRGVAVGLSGSTGWSTGPHAHVAREEDCGFGWCQSIAVSFVDVPGDGVPVTGQMVTSGNCP